jgi:SAM-dependent methyltransferase
MVEKTAYDEALSSGQYQRPSGLRGKYDNVRRFWEDEQLGLYLRPHLEELVAGVQERGSRLRILDLGCGSGDGLEMLTSINRSQSSVADHDAKVISPGIIDVYQGIDINDGLLRQAQLAYRGKPNFLFSLADFNDCELVSDQPYDLYLANYGTLSHNSDEQTVSLLTRIARRAEPGAIIVIDWLGRFSYEWQTLWTEDFEQNQWLDYVISYIHSGGDIPRQNLTHFPLRIMGRSEVMRVYEQVREAVNGNITLLSLADRSSLVGRHMDTGEYNPYCQPLRRFVNSLFEPNLGTSLDKLVVHYVPREGFDEINAYYQRLTECWNYLVLSTKALLEQNTPPQAPPRAPVIVKRALSALKRIVGAVAAIKTGHPRANLAEPQLGYYLKEIEMGLQRGLGCGHGLVAIFKV